MKNTSADIAPAKPPYLAGAPLQRIAALIGRRIMGIEKAVQDEG